MARRKGIKKESCNLFLPSDLVERFEEVMGINKGFTVLSHEVAKLMQEKLQVLANNPEKNAESIKLGSGDIEISLKTAMFDIFSNSEWFHNNYFEYPDGDKFPIFTPENGQSRECTSEEQAIFTAIRTGLIKTIAKMKLHIDKLTSRV